MLDKAIDLSNIPNELHSAVKNLQEEASGWEDTIAYLERELEEFKEGDEETLEFKEMGVEALREAGVSKEIANEMIQTDPREDLIICYRGARERLERINNALSALQATDRSKAVEYFTDRIEHLKDAKRHLRQIGLRSNKEDDKETQKEIRLYRAFVKTLEGKV